MKNSDVCAHLCLCVSVCMDGDVKKRITGWWGWVGGGVRWGITRIEAEVLWAGIRRTANVHFTIKPGWSVCGQ